MHDGRDRRSTVTTPVDRYGPADPGTLRIVQTVRTQLEAAGVPQSRQWQPYTGFILGYIEALTDLNAVNGGHEPRGPQSRRRSLSVLQALCADVQARTIHADAELRSSDECALGRSSALDDYDLWSLQPMTGIEAYIDASRARLLRAKEASTARSTMREEAT